MATPDFVLALRERIGTHPLWLCGATAVVTRGRDVLLVRRADDGQWSPVTGIVDPGEEPADAAVRETVEEAGVRARPTRLAWVHVTPEVTYPNGDRSQYVDIVFALDWIAGEPHPADGENTDARWFDRDALPAMDPQWGDRVRVALSGGPARFGPM